MPSETTSYPVRRRRPFLGPTERAIVFTKPSFSAAVGQVEITVIFKLHYPPLLRREIQMGKGYILFRSLVSHWLGNNIHAPFALTTGYAPNC